MVQLHVKATVNSLLKQYPKSITPILKPKIYNERYEFLMNVKSCGKYVRDKHSTKQVEVINNICSDIVSDIVDDKTKVD